MGKRLPQLYYKKMKMSYDLSFNTSELPWQRNDAIITAFLKVFPVFNVLETCRVHLLTIDLGIVKFIKKCYFTVFLYDS